MTLILGDGVNYLTLRVQFYANEWNQWGRSPHLYYIGWIPYGRHRLGFIQALRRPAHRNPDKLNEHQTELTELAMS